MKEESKKEGKKSNKVTIYEIAQKLNISIATVSRALNGKEDISDDTRRLVIAAADRMGYKASKTASSLSRKEKKFVVLLPGVMQDYTDEVHAGVKQALEDLRDYRVTAEVYNIDQNVEAYTNALEGFARRNFHGAVVIPPENEIVLKERIKDCRIQGMPIVSVTTDLGKGARLFSVQSNAKVSGRLAAQMLGIALGGRGKAAFVTGQMTSWVHRTNEEGFRQEIKEQGVEYVGTYEHNDSPQKAYRLAEVLMREHPDLDGIYLGTANSVTFCERLKELGYLGKVKIVASDLFPRMIEFLKQGAVMATIFQNPFLQGRLAVRYLFEYLTGQRLLTKEEILIEPQLILKSNLESFEEKLRKDI